ncbi:MAG: PspC domain-containing protein [Actinomycetota bacterium]|nr:PspC domain-containing protein [Actinomycetota bacterium]
MSDQYTGAAPPPPPYGAPQPPFGAPRPPYGQPGGQFGWNQYPYGPPGQIPPRRQLRRSRTNRRICGVAGGLAEYLGADAGVVRLGFILVSVMCLAVFGGLILYVIACAVIPEESPAPAPAQGPQTQAWERPDRTARSWALVLGATAVALIWSFGLARWWHSGAPFAWLIFGGAAFWFFTRRRHPGRSCSRPVAPGVSAGTATPAGPGGPGAPGAQAGPAGPVGPDAQAGPASPSGATYARSAYGEAGPGQPGPVPAGPAVPGSPPFGLTAEEAADWAAARAAAAGWAEEQLAAAGVPPAATSGPVPASPASRQGRRGRPVGAVLAALVAGFVLLVVTGVIATTLASGASLGGGVGNVAITPASLPQVKTHYRLGVGSLEVDLSQVKFPARGKTVDVSVGVGQLRLVLPRNTLVNLDASSGLPLTHISRGGLDTRAGHTQLSMPPGLGLGRSPAHELTVKAHVGVGVIDVSWGS